jgi:hypothetical protein
LTSFKFAMSFLVPLFIVGYLVFCGRVALREPRANLAVATVHALLLVSTVAFVFAFETRVYLVLLPFVAFNLWQPPRGAKRPLHGLDGSDAAR